MGDKSYQELLAYYDDRAKEYDDVYLGKGTIVPRPELYKSDAIRIGDIVSSFGRGHMIDIGCGTGFWLPYYHKNCGSITLVDSSMKMIAECKKRLYGLNIGNKCHYLHGDFFKLDIKDIFDSVLIGHVLCHFTQKLEFDFFERLKQITAPHAQVLIIDSLWNDTRKHYREKEGIQERVLKNGRKFCIFKKYYSKSDIEQLFANNYFKMISCFYGDLVFAAVGEKKK